MDNKNHMVVKIKNENVKFNAKDVQCFIQINLSVRMNNVKSDKAVFI